MAESAAGVKSRIDRPLWRTKGFQVKMGQGGEVECALAQGRHFDRDDVEPVIEVLAESCPP
jgi:hypothetical protein